VINLAEIFPNALAILTERLEKNEPRKKGKWMKQSLQEHLRHLSGHYNGLCRGSLTDDDLAGVPIRAIMGLEVRERAVIGKATNENRLLDREVDAILAQLDLSGWTILANGVTQLIKEAAGEGAASTLLALGLDEKEDADVFSVANEAAVDFAERRGAELVGMKIDEGGNLIPNPNPKWAITDGTRALLRDTIHEALKAGTSPGELRQQLVGSYAFSPSRALSIARTETARAFGQGSLTAAKNSGVVDGKEWDLGSEHPHEDECDDNAAAGVIDIDDEFPSGDQCEPAHPGCECAVIYRVQESGDEA